MTAVTEPAAAAADEPPGPEALPVAREAWCAVLSLHGDLDPEEWAELVDEGPGPGGPPAAARQDPR